MKRKTRKIRNAILVVSLFIIVAMTSTAIAQSVGPSLPKASLSLHGRETQGVEYSIIYVQIAGSRLSVAISCRPLEDKISLIDYFVYTDRASNPAEWNDALSYGDRLVGSWCDPTFLLPGETEELGCESEDGARDGAGYIITYTYSFDDSASINFNDAVLHLRVGFFEDPQQEMGTSAAFMLPLAGYLTTKAN